MAFALNKLAEGIILITALGAGLATVLTAVGLLTVHIRRRLVDGVASNGEAEQPRRPRLRRIVLWLGRWMGLIAPCILTLLGMALVLWGLSSARVIGGA